MIRHYPPRKPRSPHGHWSPDRDRAVQAAFRAALMRQAGGRCEYVDRGERCPAMTDLQAHHTSPTTGLLLCRPHHRLLDPNAR